MLLFKNDAQSPLCISAAITADSHRLISRTKNVNFCSDHLHSVVVALNTSNKFWEGAKKKCFSICRYPIPFPSGNPVCDLQYSTAPAQRKVTNQCVMSPFVSAAHVASGQAGYNGRQRTEGKHWECLGKASPLLWRAQSVRVITHRAEENQEGTLCGPDKQAVRLGKL